MKTQASNQPNPQLWPKFAARLPALEFRRAPLLAAACWFALGEVMARNPHPAAVLLITLAALLLLAFAALRYSPRVALLPVAAVWIAVGSWCAEFQPFPPSQRALAAYADGLSRQVRGRVLRVRTLPPQAEDANHDQETGWWPEKEETEEAAVAGALSIDLQVDAVEEVTPDVTWMNPTPGGVRMNVVADRARSEGAVPDTSRALLSLSALQCGDGVQAPMRLKIPERYRDLGAWQYADYLLEQGIGASATVRASKLARLQESSVPMASRADQAALLQCKVFAAQSWASNRVVGYVSSKANRTLPLYLRLNQKDAGMLNAMMFGDRTRLNKAQRVGFERTGSFHLFVVSGMHVALLAGLVFWLARRLHLRDSVATALTLALTFAYAILTGFASPVQRALFMTAVFLIARLLSRDRNVMNALGAAALAVLVWTPDALFQASFQMTFLAIVAIGGIAIPLGERSFLPYARAAQQLPDKWIDSASPPRVAQFRVMLRLWESVFARLFGRWSRTLPSLLVQGVFWALELALVGLVAELVMVLPMALYFHRATTFAVPANMLSVPLVGVLAPLSILTFCASLLSPWLATLPGAFTALLLHGIAGVIGHVSALQAADLRVPPPMWGVAVLAIVAWAFCCWAARRSDRWAWAAAAILPLVVLIVLWPEHAQATADVLEVTAVDVGQGDSIFVVAPNGATMLIDAGGQVGSVTETAEATSRFDIGEEVVSPYLWSRRFRRLDVLALSHAHSDHMGGMPAILRNFRPRELWVSIDPNSEAYRNLLAEAHSLGVTVRRFHAGDQMSWNETQISVLAPEAVYANPNQPVNNDSLVLRMQFGQSSVLLEGDAEAPSERAMLDHGRITAATLLKVGHHGSRTSTTQAFFDAVHPKDAVVSVGRGNTFGHPRYEVIQRIAEAHTKLYRTDEFGLTTFLLDRDGRIRELVGASNR